MTVGNFTIILLLRFTILSGSVSLDTEFGEQNYPPSLQHRTAAICGGICARVYHILLYVYGVVKKVHVHYLIS